MNYVVLESLILMNIYMGFPLKTEKLVLTRTLALNLNLNVNVNLTLTPLTLPPTLTRNETYPIFLLLP